MTESELDRLAELIARAVRDTTSDGTRPPREAWLPAPVRPATSQRGGEPAPWTGAAQSLGDVAPIRHPVESAHRATIGELTVATRAAAAGRPASRQVTPADMRASVAKGRAPSRPHPAGVRLPISIPVGVSNRHAHLSTADLRTLFGSVGLHVDRALSQPKQFAATERVDVAVGNARLDGVRIVGPARGETQLELARSDAATLGIEPPVARSGDLQGSLGGITLVGPNGRVTLQRGVIIAARHLHLSPADAARWGMHEGDRLDVRCGDGSRSSTLHDVVVRTGGSHATELHLDVDEANAVGVRSGDVAQIVGRHGETTRSRPLVTEHDVTAIARAGGTLPENALLTPAARDRARQLRLGGA